MNTIKLVLAGFLGGMIVAAVIFILAAQPQGIPISLSESPTPMPFKVYITGAVTNPGVYAVEPNTRVEDVVLMAGGFTGSALKELVNLAAPIKDGERIIIPDQSKAVQNIGMGDKSISLPVQSALVNINTADQKELSSLPGIGETKAQSIIDYREKNGLFSTIEDIQEVPGIGVAIFSQIKDLISAP